MKKFLLILILWSITSKAIVINQFLQADGTTITKSGSTISVKAVGQQLSSTGSGSFTSSSAAATDVTNLTVTITTIGRPVEIKCIHDGTFVASGGFFSIDSSGAAINNPTGYVYLKRDSTVLSVVPFGATFASTSTAYNVLAPPSLCNYIDPVAAGTYVYKIQVAVGFGTNLTAQHLKLSAYEIP